jgi:hypothetical protein
MTPESWPAATTPTPVAAPPPGSSRRPCQDPTAQTLVGLDHQVVEAVQPAPTAAAPMTAAVHFTQPSRQPARSRSRCRR